MIPEDLLPLVCDLPLVLNGKLHNGTAINQPKYCTSKCELQDCVKFAGKPPGHYFCSKGFCCYATNVANLNLVLNGLIVSGINDKITGERRRALRTNVVLSETVLATLDRVRHVSRIVQGANGKAAKDSVSFLHDVRTSVGLVLSWCQAIVAQAPGATFDDKLSNVDRPTRNLFQAISLLKEQLDLGDIIVNPAAITYGPKRKSSLVGFLYRMSKIFEPRAEERQCEIEFTGGRELEITTWNSFQFIPLVLIDNALKYSFRNRTIRIHVWEENSGPCFSVSSYGTSVPPEYYTRIFDKYVRAPSAYKEHPEGMGLGLFIAKEIADAHGFRIFYNPQQPFVPVGNNEFVVQFINA